MQQISKLKTIKIFLFALLLFAAEAINAQVGIGIKNPTPSAQLDVTSTNKGFLPPRMTASQRNAIVKPALGLMIWCTDCGLSGEISVYNGTSWGKTTGRVGKNYYVKDSSHGGNDKNDGLTPSTAWRTINEVNIQMGSFKPGDSILFERGSYFFGTLQMKRSGTAENPIIFSAFGSGTKKPVFIGALTIWGESIADLHPQWNCLGDGVWEYKDDVIRRDYPKAPKPIDVANLVLRVKGQNQDIFGVKLMNTSWTPLKIRKVQGGFWFDYFNPRILIYSAIDPRRYYTSIQCVLTINAINFFEGSDKTRKDYSYLIFENLDFRYYGKCVVEESGNYCSFKNLDISYIGGGDWSEGLYLNRAGNGLQIWNDDSRLSSHDITITGCKIDNVYDAGISPQGISSQPLSVYNIYIRNNVITKCEYSFEFFERTSLDIYEIKPRPHNNDIYIHDIYFENNTCVNAGGEWSHDQREIATKSDTITKKGLEWGYITNGTHFRFEAFDGTKSNIFIRNNIFYGATEKLYWILWAYDYDIGNIVSDYNDFWQTDGEPIVFTSKPAKTYDSLSAWKQVMSKDIHSYNDSALFVSPTDFHLQPGSPLIGKGIDLGYGKYLGAYPYVDAGN